jgi:hypothetical protein
VRCGLCREIGVVRNEPVLCPPDYRMNPHFNGSTHWMSVPFFPRWPDSGKNEGDGGWQTELTARSGIQYHVGNLVSLYFILKKITVFSEKHEKNFPLNPVGLESGTLCAEDYQVSMKILWRIWPLLGNGSVNTVPELRSQQWTGIRFWVTGQ